MSAVNPYPFGFQELGECKTLEQLETYLAQELDGLARYLQKNITVPGSGGSVTAAILALQAAVTAIDAAILFPFTTETVNATATLTVPGTGTRFRYFLDVQAGSGAYTYTINLSASTRSVNDTIFFNLFSPLSTNPTLVFNDVATSTTLLNVTFLGVTINATELEFYWDGTQWQLAATYGSSTS